MPEQRLNKYEVDGLPKENLSPHEKQSQEQSQIDVVQKQLVEQIGLNMALKLEVIELQRQNAQLQNLNADLLKRVDELQNLSPNYRI